MKNYSRIKIKWLCKSLIYLSLSGSSISLAQKSDYEILLKSGTHIPMKQISLPSKANLERSRNAAYNYVMIQFYKLPTLEERKALLSSGVILLEYVPNNAYWAKLKSDLTSSRIKNTNIRSITPIQSHYKIDSGLINRTSEGEISIVISYFEIADKQTLVSQLSQLNVSITKHHDQLKKLEARCHESTITSIAEISEVSYISPIAPASVSGDSKSTNSHRAHILHSRLLGGKNLSGEGIAVGVGDAGYVGPHPDLQNRVTNIKSTILEGWAAYGHEVHVSGIVAGNGNIDETQIGMAPKAHLITDQAESIIYSTPDHVANHGMVLTNNSYWWFSNNPGAYNYLSSYVDDQLLQYPNLQHVVIAGNPGSEYGKVEGYFASAKNTLTVGSVDAYDNISSFSGRGPCLDGRLKPEIVAVGDGVSSTLPENGYATYYGTSMACPGVTGTLALLYQYYKNIYGTLPNAALIKAIACNTAQDLGNPGPDYTYGFGRINANRAAQALELGNYIEDNISVGRTATHNITIPTGTRQLKVLLYWKDKAASDAAAVALVNDLNLSINNGSATYLPWVLNPSNPSYNAIRGVDNRNNIEQITIDAPIAGLYTININGAGIASGLNQDYVITYEIIQPGIQLAYPIGGESLTPQQYAIIKWDANSTASTINLQYSINNGGSWINIASNIPASQGWYEWLVPSVASGNALIKVSDGSPSGQSISSKFSILQSPLGLSAIQSNDTIRMSWSLVPNASSYDIYLLKTEDSEIQWIASTSNNNYKLLATQNGAWLSVRAKSSDGAKSLRAQAIQPASNLNPTLSLTSPINGSSFKAPASITLQATAIDKDGSIQKVVFFNGGIKIGEDLTEPYTFTWNAVATGSYTLTAQAVDNAGALANSDKIQVQVTAVNTLPTVAITSPLDSANFTAPATFTITAGASDSDGNITKVEFYNGNTKLGEDLSKPYTFTWANVGSGTYRLSAKATDNLGESKISDFVTVKISSIQSPPTVTLTNPIANTSYAAPATIALVANATDPDGAIAKVEFYNGTTKLGEDLSAPYTYTWSGVIAGNYTLSAKAIDLTGLSMISQPISILVTSNTPPIVTIVKPANNANFTAPASISMQANASDADGNIVKVEFYNGTTKLGEDLTAPYTFTWANVTPNTYTVNVKATDNSGATAITTVTVTVTPIATVDLIGPDCGVNNSTLSYELNISKRTNATNYNWWYTGTVQSMTPTPGSTYIVTLQTSSQFAAGQICVGVTYSTTPWYTNYCKAVSKCAARQSTLQEAENIEELLSISPNPSNTSFLFNTKIGIKEYIVLNNIGQIIEQKNIDNQSLEFGQNYLSGIYMVKVYMVDGTHHTLRIDKIN